jgi:hypothetical protein
MAAAAAGTASPIATVESEHELKARIVLQRIYFKNGWDHAGGNMKKLLCSTIACAAIFASAPAIAADVPIAPRPRLHSATRVAALAEADGAATTKRFAEQRWALDDISAAVAI